MSCNAILLIVTLTSDDALRPITALAVITNILSDIAIDCILPQILTVPAKGCFATAFLQLSIIEPFLQIGEIQSTLAKF
jgi:hypothetical protein